MSARLSRKKVSLIVAVILLIFPAIALVKVDPMSFVFQRREVEIPETTNIVPDVFSQREMVSDESVRTVSQIVVGESVFLSELYSQISQDLSVAIQEKTGIHVDIVNDTTTLENNSILIGNSEVNKKTKTLANSTDLDLPSDWGPQSFVVSGLNNKPGSRFLLVFGNDSLGDAYGVYWLIEQILYGSEVSGDLFEINESRSPAVKLRILDASSAFYDPNVKPRSWWGGKIWLEQIDTDEGPYYVNETRLAESAIRFREFLNYTLKTGYNGILIHDLWHYVNFDDVVDGVIVPNYTIYSSDSKFRIRHTRYQEYFSNLFDSAERLNLSVFVYADIPTFTPPLENYIDDDGKAEVNKIVSVCLKAIEEFFTLFPTVDGIMIRTGELGGTHDAKDYHGKVTFDSFDSSRQLLTSLLDLFDEYDKTLIYRIWSIGIGEMGDIHQDPSAYDRLLSEFENEENLVVSMKYVQGDFYRYLPFNPNIGHGKIRQIVEIEAVPEYGGFSLYPNYLVEIFQELMSHLESIPYGLWVWVQEGAAPKEAGGFGPFTLFLFRGFWSNTDANAYAFGKVAWDPDVDVNNVTYTWAMRNFGTNHTTIENLSKMLLMSDDADLKALYLEDYAMKMTYIIGSIPWPPQIWIWWDVPQGSAFALANIYRACKEGRGIELNVQDGFEAVSIVEEMQDYLKGLEVKVNQDLLDYWKRSVEYERSYFTVLAYFRDCFLYFYEWTDTLNPQAASRYRAALENLKVAKRDYETTYNGSDPEQVFLPADLSELERFIKRVENTPSAVTVSRILFVALSFTLIICVVVDLRKRSSKPKGARKREQVPSVGMIASKFENLSKALVIASQMVLHPVKSFKTLGETDRFRLIVYATSTGMVLALTSTCFALLNFLVYPRQLFLFLFMCLLGLWLFSSTVFTLLAKSQSKAARFCQMLEGNAIAISVPLLYLDLILLGVFSIWGPQRIWLFWYDPIILTFAFYALILAFGWAMYLAVTMVRTATDVSRKVSLLIVITSLALLSSAVFVSLSALGLDLWGDLVYYLNRVFSVLLSTMFERGPGAGAWVPLTLWDLALASLAVTAVLVCLLLLNALISKRVST